MHSRRDTRDSFAGDELAKEKENDRKREREKVRKREKQRQRERGGREGASERGNGVKSWSEGGNGVKMGDVTSVGTLEGGLQK